jgi:hypothetical protein
MTDLLSSSTFPDFEPPPLRLRSPADVVEAVPYLVGFHPQRSIVVMALSRRRKRLMLTMRLDLPPSEHAEQAAQSLAGHLSRSGGDAVLIACYPEGADDRAAAERTVTALRKRLDELGLFLKEAVRVEDGRWWSYLCDNPQCCPPEGTVIAAEPGQVGAAAVLNGHVALPSRSALGDRLRPANEIALAAVAQALEQRVLERVSLWETTLEELQPDDSDWLGFTTELLGRYQAGRGRLSAQEAARLLDGLQDVRQRDECAEWWYAPERNSAAIGLWTDAVRFAPPGYIAAPATLLAVSAWLDGDGAFGNIALERALSDDPTYRLALLVETVIQGGISPSQFRAMRFDPPRSGRRRRATRRRKAPSGKRGARADSGRRISWPAHG